MEKSQLIKRPLQLIKTVAEGGVHRVPESENYRDLPHIANSDIKTFKKSIRKFHREKILGEDKEEEEERYKKFGTMFDNYMLNKDLFEKKYILIPEGVESPSNAYHQGYVADRIDGEIKEISYGNHYSTANKSDKKIKSKIEELEEDYGDYIDFKIKAKDKVEYTQKQSKQLSDMKVAVLSHRAGNYLIHGDEIYHDSVKAYSHLQLAADELNPYYLKGELDRLVVDFKNKIIYVVDVKTTGKRASYFESQLCKYRYYRQLANYTLLSVGWLVSKGKIQLEDLSKWSIIPCIVAVESTPRPECRTVAVPNKALVDGFIEILDAYEEISWHMEQDLWEHRRSYYRSKRGIEVFRDYRPRNYDLDEIPKEESS